MKATNTPTAESSNDILELTIDSLSYSGGRGVGRVDGLVVFVPGTAPGDRVRVRVVVRKPRFAEAELVALLSPSSQRRTPPCPVAGRCGGCSWQHVEYAEQVRQKEKILRDSLRRLSGFAWLPFLAAREEFHYRNRIQLQIQDGRRGFFAQRSRSLVEFAECWIADPAINKKLNALSAAEIGDARRLEVALTRDGSVRTWSVERDPTAALFAQVNEAQNRVLKERLLSLVNPRPSWIMDLYSGSGNLTFPLAQAFPDVPVFAVELSRASVAQARQAAASLPIEWQDGDVGKVLRRRARGPEGGLIVLDPPRPGCEREVIDQLLRHGPRQILYVSCNPSTFARDAERLQPAYRLEKVQGLDMFPQTEHVELLASFCAAT